MNLLNDKHFVDGSNDHKHRFSDTIVSKIFQMYIYLIEFHNLHSI